MKIVSDFFNKLAKHIDGIYFPTVTYYGDDKNATMVHYSIELFNNGCLTYHEFIKRLSKACNEKSEVIHSIVSQYVEDFEGYEYTDIKSKVAKVEKVVNPIDTIESDKRLVCEFMGVKPKSVIAGLYYWNDAPLFYVSEHTPEQVMDAIVGYVKYDTSWSSLMPVVEQIRKTAGALSSKDSIEKKKAFLLFGLGITTPIETVFMFVVNYIKWYNTQKA